MVFRKLELFALLDPASQGGNRISASNTDLALKKKKPKNEKQNENEENRKASLPRCFSVYDLKRYNTNVQYNDVSSHCTLFFPDCSLVNPFIELLYFELFNFPIFIHNKFIRYFRTKAYYHKFSV